MDSKVVTLIVGPEETNFVVHEVLLTKHSEFFGAAFRSNFLEGKTREMKMPEDDPRLFAIFIDYIYAREPPSWVQFGSPMTKQMLCQTVIPSYYLATKLCASQYELSIMEYLRITPWPKINLELFLVAQAPSIYLNSPTKCRLRILIVVITLWNLNRGFVCKQGNQNLFLIMANTSEYAEDIVDVDAKFRKTVIEPNGGKRVRKSKNNNLPSPKIPDKDDTIEALIQRMFDRIYSH